MQNLDVRYPGSFVNNSGFEYGASSLNLTRTQSGYTGPRIVPERINPYEFRFVEYSAWKDARTNNGLYWRTGDHGAPDSNSIDLPDIPSNTSLYNRVISKLNDQVRGSLDLSIDIAEAGQTRRMLRATDQVTSLVKTAVGRFGPLKALGRGWLTYQYGIRPLLGTLYGAADESIRFTLNRTKRFRVRETESFPLGRFGYAAAGQSWFNYVPTKSAVKRSMTVGLLLDDLDFDLARWSSLNPVSLAWELMPFSFVVDWFVNVGGYIRDLESSFLYANRFRQGYLTELKAFEGSTEEVRLAGSGGYDYRHWTKVRYKYISISRVILPSYPAPRFPTFKADLGSSRLFSAAALLSLGLSGKR